MKILFLIFLLFSTQSFAADCFFQGAVSGFSANDETHMKIDAGRNKYALEISYCSELPRAYQVGFESFMGSSRICRNDNVLVLDNFSNRVIQACRILSVTKTQ